MTTIKLIRLPHGEGLPLPFYATPGSVGADVAAAVQEDILLKPQSRALIPSGFSVILPPQHELQIRSRSGLSYKHGVVVLNSPATIDWDYQGEIKIVLANLGSEDFIVTRGMRIAQLVVAAALTLAFEEVTCSSTEASSRSDHGFGSTGY